MDDAGPASSGRSDCSVFSYDFTYGCFRSASHREKQAVRDAKKNAKKKKSRSVAAPSGQRPAGKVVSGTKGSGTGKKTPDSARDKRITAQQSIPYHEMGRDGICRVQAKEESHRKNRVAIQRRDADRTKVGKCVSHESRKAAIVFKIPVP